MYSNPKFLNSILIFLFLLVSVFGFSQKKILIYHETDGFVHSSITHGITMFADLGNENNEWITDSSNNSNVFTTENLSQYDAVVFLNTTGTNLLTDSEEIAFESFIASGKGFIGIHAAADTYRDGTWPFYNELVGAIVQNSPNHTWAGTNADIEVKINNPITNFLGSVGSTWNKDDEYYYWDLNGGQLSTDNTILLEVGETVGQNGMVNSYDAPRPTTWCKESITYDDDNNVSTPDVTLSGIKSFYTSLGHDDIDYTSNSNFRTMLKNAALWAVGSSLSTNDFTNNNENFKIQNNPVKEDVKIRFSNSNLKTSISIYDVLGKKVLNKTVTVSMLDNDVYKINMNSYNSGVYIFVLKNKDVIQSFKIIKL